MRKLILYVCESLDGYIAGPNHELDWLPPLHEASYNEFIKDIDVILMGRKTYAVTKTFEPWPYTQECIVFTSKTGLHDERVQFTSESPAQVLQALRAQPGKDIWLMGGGELIQQFHEAGLIDEYIIALIPVTIGAGIPLFVKSDKKVALQFVAARKLNDELLELHYKRK